MAFKFALLFAFACAAQGFSLSPFLKPIAEVKEFACKDHKIPEFVEKIPHGFEDAIQEMDNLRETVSSFTMNAILKGSNPETVVACFRQQRPNFVKLGETLASRMEEASAEMAKVLEDKYEKYGKPAEQPLATIAATMKMLPLKMWDSIRDLEFIKALEVLRESRNIVEENALTIAKIMSQLSEELPEAGKRAEEIALEIRAEAKQGCQAIRQAFRKCIEAGGPKNPEGDDDVAVEVEKN